ncbi:DUF6493 family protein [Streptomyces sp. NPDC003036]|uniref:DUF7824 domain-containing protein n=1 Tax=Streptomyces sp. NPDC003036 TaxID=3154442 RepID=UPI0033AF4A55
MSAAQELLKAVRAGRRDDVPALVKGLDPAGRKAALAELKELRKELRGWDWDRWQERRHISRALLVAGAGCHTGAAAASAWIGARDLRDWERLPTGMLLDLLADRETGWLGDVAHRLAGRAATAEEDYPLIHELVRLSGCAVPVTDGYVHGWADAVAQRGILAALRTDPYVRALVPRLFETTELPSTLTWRSDDWQAGLVALADEGVVERAVLIDACVARLLRGAKPGAVRFFLDLLRQLKPTADEERARKADWMGMAADGPSTVAAHAQEVLGRLSEAGDLSARELAEVSGAVLFRTEKKLVRAQLVLVGKALRRGGADAADELLPAIAEAFGHPDTGVQERVLKLVARHLSEVDEDTRAGLAEAAVLLGPAHRAAAAELFGEVFSEAFPAAGEAEPYEELLPPAPQDRRVAPAADGLPELVEDVAVLLKSGDDVIGVERALDGLVRYAYRDREALREALLPLVADLWWYGRDSQFMQYLQPLDIVVGTVVGKVTTGHLHAALRAEPAHDCVHRALDRLPLVRAQEAAVTLLKGKTPYLLAVPTWHTGAVDPGELVERLRGYQQLGVAPGDIDFAQALLRVRRSGPEAARAAEDAARLGTPTGERLARWLTAKELWAPAVRGVAEGQAPVDDWFRWTRLLPRRIVLRTDRDPGALRDFPPAFRVLESTPSDDGRRCYHWSGASPHWTAVLPEDRERLATWLLPLAAAATDDLRGGTSLLAPLAEAGGEAGPALHLALATGLGARYAEDRLVAVDALLVLAARGELDAVRLGGDLAELVRLGTVKPNRLADSVRTSAATGAYATTWAVLASALPGMVDGGEPVRGLGEILAVAADCVERCGAVPADGSHGPVPRGPIPGLDALAARRGSSQLVTQAKRLARALARTTDSTAHPVEQSTPEAAETSH